MKKCIALILTAAFALAVLTAAVAEGQVRTTGSVNLRTGPGLDYAKIDAVKSGTVLDYLDETSTDARGVDWYLVSFGGSPAWISSRYAELTAAPVRGDAGSVAGSVAPAGSVDTTGYIELSDFYTRGIADAAVRLELDDYRVVAESEAPNQYSNGVLTIGGGDLIQFFDLTGTGYTIYGVAVGMDMETARALLISAGLVEMRAYSGVTFERPSDERSLVDVEGYDSCVNLYPDQDGYVNEIDWSCYTG